ncbi:MAG: hypothetical protein J7M20_06065 [Deltaproteobacteria bacterium]|nr:hypothetical protein [Deltaproteobacteria bacterium]
MKKVMLPVCMVFLGMFVMSAHAEARSAEESIIKDYTFTWHVARTMIGGTTIEVQKTPEALVVIFGRTSIPLCALTISPVQANAVGELLKKTEEYYQLQKKTDDPSSSDTLTSHNCVVNFSSKQGRDFRVRVKQNEVFGPVVLMEREEAIEAGKYLRKAEQMASFADKRIRP